MGVMRIKKGRENPFTMIHNDILDDERLTWKAKGIMSYLLRLPDDWEHYEEELSTHSKDGLKSFKSGIKELIDLGYVERTQLRDNKGRFIGYEYCIHEIPPESTKTDNGETENGKADNRKRHATNTNPINTDLNYTHEEEETLIQNYKNAKGRSITKLERKKLLELLNEYDKDLILKSIDEMVLRAEKVNLKYIQTTLEDWNSKSLSTLEQVEEYLTKFEVKKAKVKENREKAMDRAAEGYVPNKKPSAFSDYNQREYSPEQLAEMERKLRGIDG